MNNRWIPNSLTACRMAGTLSLLFLKPLSTPFYVAYTLSGLSDVLDGTAARALHCTSDFGAKLDSWADLAFYGVMLLRMFPLLVVSLPTWIWACVGLDLVIRMICYLTAWRKFHRFASLHTWMNKASGLAVFLIPYSMGKTWELPYCLVAVAVAGLAAVEELIIHATGSTYDPKRKSIFHRA